MNVKRYNSRQDDDMVGEGRGLLSFLFLPQRNRPAGAPASGRVHAVSLRRRQSGTPFFLASCTLADGAGRLAGGVPIASVRHCGPKGAAVGWPHVGVRRAVLASSSGAGVRLGFWARQLERTMGRRVQ